jgi:hypothetical protein
MSLKSTLLATAVAGASLLAAGSAQAATGHACKTNAGAAGCTAANLVANATALTAGDVGSAAADDFLFTGGPNNLRCTRAQGAGTLTSNGGTPPTSTGPAGNLTSLTLDNGAGVKCTGLLAGVAVTGTVVVNDSNGATAGLVNVQGDWAAGAPTLVLQNLSVTATLYSGASVFATCSYTAAAFTGTVSNAATGRVTFTNQALTKSAGPTVCPVSGTASVPVNLTTATGPVYVSA